MTRTERQQEAVRAWIKYKGKGTLEMPTGFGKTNSALMALKAVNKKYPDLRILVVVPTETLQAQWIQKIDEEGLTFNAEVQIINTVIKHKWSCGILVIDEIHRTGAEEFSKVFKCVSYKLILGLTATFDRLDGKQALIAEYCPIVNVVTLLECQVNGWISEYKEYQVIIDVDDIDTYKSFNKEWIEHFEFLQYDFNLAKSLCGKDGWKAKLAFRDELYKGDDENMKKQILQAINYHSVAFMRTMQKRKAFINNHPKKIEIAKKIIEARPNCKIITFSNNVKMAEAIENKQYVYTGKTGKAKGRVMIEDFLTGKINHLHSCHKLNEGFDAPDASVAIVLGTDSSETKARQRRGRVIRKYGNKQAEVFYLIINNSVESKWFQNSHKTDRNFITIDEKGLEQVLRGEQPDLFRPKIGEIMFRF